MPRRIVCVVCLSLALLSASPEKAPCDLVRLSNGGHLRGAIDESKRPASAPDVVELRTLTGGRVVVERQHVESLVQRRHAVEVYETRVKDAPDTVDAQWELAEWCRDNRLAEQRRSHLLNVVRLDPDHEQARRLVGHVRRQGEWVSRDDEMLKQGYVKYKGEFVTLQERELLEKQNARREAEKEWHKKIRGWYVWADGRNPRRRDEGMKELLAVSDPDAIPALSHFLQNNRDLAWRTRFVEILGRMPGERPVGALAHLALHDADTNVRSAAYDAIGAERHILAIPTYVQELQNGFNVIVCRAGAALGKVGDAHVVPQLIDALVTTHNYRLRVPTNEGTYSFNRNGTMGTGELLLPPEIEQALRTGQLQHGVVVLQPNKPVRTKLVSVRRDHQNADVLAALTKITGESFDYDENAWRIWWASQKNQPAG